ncbi:ribose-phosphate pyrophosphokinase [Candidatus Kaiserbacteria bacterium]|nr:ribose-phosphate pyrophosphokinase [Candidatus Kaiserbacteria bacterium]
MHILNLKAGFEPLGPGDIPLLKSEIFAGGEIDLAVGAVTQDPVTIVTRLNGSDDIMELLMATDALKEMGCEKIHVFFPYLPYARQDRVMKPGEAFSLRVFADLLNAQGYASVTVFDAHSDVGPALIRRCRVISNHALVARVLAGRSNYVLLSPDSGAFKKISKLADALRYQGDIALCNKVRVTDGAIASVTVTVSDFAGADVFIVDDICDGGRTFIALAQEIRKRNAGKIYLIVSHGIFSYGEEPLRSGGIDHVFTTDSIRNVDSDYITQVTLCDIRI